MKIEVHRQACSSQDDQLGPLSMAYELPDRCSVEDLLRAVIASRFLQFSSTHTAMRCCVAGVEVATVFSPHVVPVREPIFIVDSATLVRSIAPNHPDVEFVFVRA
jgi:hypothetical protein